MAISAISNAVATAANTVTMPTHATGDLIIVTAWRNASTAAPTVPSGWTLVGSSTGTTCFLGIYFKIAQSASEVTGTWTNANAVEVNVYRGAEIAGPPTFGTGSGTTMTYPALTLTTTGSTSWAFRVAGNKSATNMITNVPSGYTARGGAATVIRGCDSNAGLASSPGTGTQATSPTGIWIAASVELMVPLPQLSTITDTFDAGINLSLWTPSSGQVVASSGRIRINHTALSQYNDYNLNTTYDVTGNGGYLQIPDAGNQSLVSHEVIFLLDRNFAGTDALMFYITGGSLFAYAMAASVQNAVGSSVTYNATTHKWLRIREAGGTCFWDTSPDGTTWTNFASLANPINVTSMAAIARCGNWQDEATASYADFDNFNTLGPTVNPGQFFAMLG